MTSKRRFAMNKLVRDQAPKILEDLGLTVDWSFFQDNARYQEALLEKLSEECQEVREAAGNLDAFCEELADVLEVIRSLASAHGISMEKIEKIRQHKFLKKGGFFNKVYMKSVSGTSDNPHLQYFANSPRYPEMKSIQVVPYDPNWVFHYEKEAALIRKALGKNCLAVYHIGSTSVPGLTAKPIVDVLVVVQKALLAREPLEKIGLRYRCEYNIPLRYFFSKKGDQDGLHLHLCEANHPEIELNLMFRDYLRAHPQKRDAYAALKEKLVQDDSSSQKKEHSTFTDYTLRKGDFIREVLKETGFSKRRILKCNDDTEWKAAKHFRQTYFFGPYGIEDPYTWTFHHQEHAHLILYQGSQIEGYAHLQFWHDQRVAIRIIAIDEQKRNQKAGSTFLSFLEKWLKALGTKSIHAESRQSSLNFYLKNGYHKLPFDDPEEHPTDSNDVPVGKLL